MGEGKKTDCHTGERVTGVAMTGWYYRGRWGGKLCKAF